MEKNANYALVGLSSLILLVGAIIFFVWLARLQFAATYDVYDIVFQGPVRGISEGGEVHFNGIKVGEVTEIALDETNPTNVIAQVRVDSKVPIKTDSFATLEPQGITGVNYIQISAGTPTAPLLKETVPDDEIPVIRSQRSALSDLLEGGGTVLARTVEALDRINKVMSDENIQTFSAALEDTQAVTAELRANREIIAETRKAIQDVDAAVLEVTELTRSTRGLVEGDGARAVASLADAAEEADAAAAALRSMLAKLEQPTSEFATNGLPEITNAVVSLQTAAESLQRLTEELRTSPQGLVGKAPAKTIEVKP